MHDIDLLLAQTDLAALADELVGQRKGSGVSAKWPSPVPGQHGTGQSPPMGIFIGRDGTQRWKDFATGEGGTAIDLIKVVRNVSTKDALDELGARTGSQPAPVKAPDRVRRGDQVGDRSRTDGTPRIAQYIEDTHRFLDHPKARLAHRWLASHGISLEHAVANKVGYDPGPRTLTRPGWLPQWGPAVVLPVTDVDRIPIYVTTRNLRPGGPKYVNPKSTHASNPTISIVEHRHDGPLVLTEGVVDALLVSQHGYNAAALIGTGVAAQTQWVEPLLAAAGDKPVVLAFDNDNAGRTATTLAARHLTTAGIVPLVLGVPDADLGQWANTSGTDFGNQLRFGLAHAEQLPTAAITHPKPQLRIAP